MRENKTHPSRRGEDAAPQDKDILFATGLETQDLYLSSGFPHASVAPRSALAAGAAQRDRRYRRAGPQPADGARRHHRSADFGEADPGGRLGVSSRTRGRHDAPAGAAPSRHPAARHRRKHLARHHLDVHLCAGAVFGARRYFARRIRDAGFGAVSFRLYRSLRLAFQRAGRGRRGGHVEGRSGAGLRHFQPHPMVDRTRSGERADHPAALPVFVVSRVADSAMVTEVEMWSVRVSGWNAEIARALSPLAEIVAVPDTAFDGAALLVSVAGSSSLQKIKAALIEAGASVRSSALVGSHATRYTVPNGTAK